MERRWNKELFILISFQLVGGWRRERGSIFPQTKVNIKISIFQVTEFLLISLSIVM